MRTTIRLDDRLYAEVKQLAAQTGRTLTAVVEDALREVLSRRKEAAEAERVGPAGENEGKTPGAEPAVSGQRLNGPSSADAAD